MNVNRRSTVNWGLLAKMASSRKSFRSGGKTYVKKSFGGTSYFQRKKR